MREAIAKAKHLAEHLNFLGAFEILEPYLDEQENDLPSELLYLAILSLARAGATEAAQDLFDRYRLCLGEDEASLSLEGRLYKDLFFAGTENAAGERALGIYERVYRKTKGYFPGINAATLALLLGNPEKANTLAKQLLEMLEAQPDSYWKYATAAEANLLLGERDVMSRALRDALQFQPTEEEKASTYRQLKVAGEFLKLESNVFGEIRPKTIACYSGQLLHGLGRTPGIDPGDQPELREAIANIIKKHDVGHAFGALACGGDILVAEAILESGGNLHVVLPFAPRFFREISVAAGGQDWAERFDRLLEQARSVHCLVDDPHSNFDLLFRSGAQLAMGKAKLMANRTGAETLQIALWNGVPAVSESGTAYDIERWQAAGGVTEIIRTPDPRARVAPLSFRAHVAKDDAFKRSFKALVFADLSGFSKLTESEVTKVFPIWTSRLSTLLGRHSGTLRFVNTWGDAVYLVLNDVEAAAQCALELASLCDGLKEELQLKNKLSFRVSAHVAPVFEVYDPILRQVNFIGAHVNTTARMEPCTPPGAAYVTEEFAALIALNAESKVTAQYAGVRELPKGAGTIRMYRLRRSAKTI